MQLIWFIQGEVFLFLWKYEKGPFEPGDGNFFNLNGVPITKLNMLFGFILPFIYFEYHVG